MNKTAQAMIKNTFLALSEEKKQKELKYSLNAPRKRAAAYLNISERTVYKYMRTEGLVDTPSKKRKKTTERKFGKIDDFTKDLVRRILYDFYDKNVIPSLNEIHREVVNRTSGTDYEFPYKLSTLRDILIGLGFKYKLLKNKRRILVEKTQFKEWRLRYLDTVEEARRNGRPLVYLDETWFNVNDVKKKGWSDDSIRTTSRQPLGKGERIIITAAVREVGWIPNSLDVMRTNTTGHSDYHKDMNAQKFEEWLQDDLIPNLPANAVVVYDNASYHTRIKGKIPRKSWRNADIEDWLERNTSYKKGDVMFKKDMLKLVEDSHIKQTYAVDEMLKEKGFLPVRLPPYHCHLNPIELVWSSLKRRTRSANVDWKGKAVKELLQRIGDQIETSVFSNSFSHVEKVEHREKVRDLRTENDMHNSHNGRMIISIEEEDSEEEDIEIQFESPESIDED